MNWWWINWINLKFQIFIYRCGDSLGGWRLGRMRRGLPCVTLWSWPSEGKDRPTLSSPPSTSRGSGWAQFQSGFELALDPNASKMWPSQRGKLTWVFGNGFGWDCVALLNRLMWMASWSWDDLIGYSIRPITWWTGQDDRHNYHAQWSAQIRVPREVNARLTFQGRLALPKGRQDANVEPWGIACRRRPGLYGRCNTLINCS